MNNATATAHSNIALVKYWGKRTDTHPDMNLPAVGSLSMTLEGLRTVTQVIPGAARDAFRLDDAAVKDHVAAKVFTHLDRVWTALEGVGTRPPCEVTSTNHLPTAAGLASSASGFAALTVAAYASLGDSRGDLMRDPDVVRRLSALARRGSGSAARSLWGGFVRLDAGTAPDGHDCVAAPVAPRDHWAVRLLVVHTARGPKPVGSTGGMERCRETSPYFPAWVSSSTVDLDAATTHLRERNLSALGEIMEHSCFKMHAAMWTSRPPLIYWNGVTMEVLHAVRTARAEGLQGWSTSDAGPHVKVLCTQQDAPALAERLAAVPGVHTVDVVGVGPDASVEVHP